MNNPMHSIDIQGERLTWSLTRSKRKTVGMVFDAGTIRVRAPRWVTLAEIETILQSKHRWVKARLLEWRHAEQHRLEPAEEWCDGAQIQFLGQACTLRLLPEIGAVTWSAERAEILLPLSASATPEQLKDTTHSWMQQQAKAILQERLETLAERARCQFTRFSLSHAKTRWGSCTVDGHIRLNWRLIRFSLAVIDYVVAHELAHLRTMDHSPGFWAEVGQILPGFEEGKALIRRAPLEPPAMRTA